MLKIALRVNVCRPLLHGVIRLLNEDEVYSTNSKYIRHLRINQSNGSAAGRYFCSHEKFKYLSSCTLTSTSSVPAGFLLLQEWTDNE